MHADKVETCKQTVSQRADTRLDMFETDLPNDPRRIMLNVDTEKIRIAIFRNDARPQPMRGRGTVLSREAKLNFAA